MRFISIGLAGVVLTTGLLLSGCNLEKELPWQLSGTGGSTLLHNGETGQVFAVVDGHLMEVERIARSELSEKSFSTHAMPDSSLNFEIKTVFRNGRVHLQVNATLNSTLAALPEPDFTNVQRLQDIVYGKDEEVADVNLNILDSSGILLFSLDTSDFELTRITGQRGELEQIKMSADRNISPLMYRLISKADTTWMPKR